MESIYICITCDLINSSLSDNSVLIDQLPKILDKINTALKPVVPFSVYAGDEIQGIINEDVKIFEFIDLLEFKLFPLSFRTGIGIGTISTDIKETSQAMRGEAFVFARMALDIAKQKKKKYVLQSNFDDTCLQVILDLLGFIKNQWKELLVFRRYNLYKQYKSISTVAKEENVSKEAVNKTIVRYGIREYQMAVKEINKTIRESTFKG